MNHTSETILRALMQHAREHPARRPDNVTPERTPTQAAAYVESLTAAEIADHFI